jgi:arginyl-tRNA synthetase
VAGSDAEAERGEIVSVFLKIMTHGLDLLGIKVPEEM